MWRKDKQFHIVVSRAYQQRPKRSKVHQLTQIQKRMQKPLQQLNGNRLKDIHNQLAISKAQLEEIQNQLQHDLRNRQLQEKERVGRERYIDILDSSTKLMRQQSKLECINGRDHYTKFFFAKMKQRKQANYIFSINDYTGNRVDGFQAVAKVMTEFYQKLLVVCLPKANGGVGLKNLEAWNKAWITKLVWEVAKKKDNLWIKWVYEKNLINKDWWDYNIVNDGSTEQKKWYWKGNPKGEYKVKTGYEWYQNS
ncbi:hypothetical protein Cgig2_007179 [Carnegiea gigantea]|uniref:Uncharacterized protein n=1 Tax=Carnegiea gigantea TaxID=171969 RepID=A0A9Q1JFD7_9CARY|nr:hypothetical protein Cgig2_007179 [Carnegiea gigantea]